MTQPIEAVPITLCADDFGIAPGVDDGIVALAESGRLTAVSCMTVLPRWPAAAQRLVALASRVDIGLHFTLTGLSPLGVMPKFAPDGQLPSLGPLLVAAMARCLAQDEIAAEFARQLDAFGAALGRLPDFVDGHQHVHQFPGVRNILTTALADHGNTVWLRNTATTPSRLLRRRTALPRAAFLAAVGFGARDCWRAAGFATNADFAGVRDFNETAPYSVLMRRFLADAQPDLLIMCHPGRVDAELSGRDPVTAPRAEELAYLGGPQFADDLAAAGCRLVRPGARQTSSACG